MGRKIKSVIEYLLFRFFAIFIQVLPLKTGYYLGHLLVSVIYPLLPKRNNILITNLKSAFPEKNPAEIDMLAKQVWYSVAHIMVETIKMLNLDKNTIDKYVEIVGTEEIDKALQKGKGIITFTAHIGNWELTGGKLAWMGYPMFTVTQHLSNQLLDRIVIYNRSRTGMVLVPRQHSTATVLKMLKQNKILYILIDQNLSDGGIFVNFFGRLAATTPIVALLAKKSGAAVLPVSSKRLDNGKIQIKIHPEIKLTETGNLRETVQVNTQIYTQCVEQWIKDSPEQWFWVHNRWKTQPAKENLI